MTEQKTRAIGQRIRQACAIAESVGPCTYRQVHDRMEGVELQNASKYLSRAVGLGLMTVIHSPKGPRKPSVFTVVPEWRTLLERHATTRTIRVAPARKEPVSPWKGISSVWVMAV